MNTDKQSLLYIGPYRCECGYGRAARDFGLALAKSQFDVSIRPVYTSNSIAKSIPQELWPLELCKRKKYDVVIQHCLPHMFDYEGEIPLNIGMFFSETRHLNYTSWPAKCNEMDGILVCSEVERDSLAESGVTSNIKKIHLPIDTTIFDRTYDSLLNSNVKMFNFYFIGEYVERKNLTALLVAFHTEFSPQEPVNLVIKLNRQGIPGPQLQQKVMADIQQLKQAMRLYTIPSMYKQEVVITDYLSDLDMYKLHTSCDCFVMPSRGEAWCLPAMVALGFGNTPIVTAKTGMTEFIDNSCGWVVPSMQVPTLTADAPLPDLYTGRETWQEISILGLRKAMREAFDNKDKREEKRLLGRKKISMYSYAEIAKKIDEAYLQ